jgi:uncharacterized tellurite resistance protein B-like protein
MDRPLDTSAEARRRQLAIYRSMTPSQRLQLAATMSDEVQAIAESGIRHRHPESTAVERAAELAGILRHAGETAARHSQTARDP